MAKLTTDPQVADFIKILAGAFALMVLWVAVWMVLSAMGVESGQAFLYGSLAMATVGIAYIVKAK